MTFDTLREASRLLRLREHASNHAVDDVVAIRNEALKKRHGND